MQDRRKGAGKAVGAFFGKLVDLHGDEQKLRRHQQDDGGNGGDAADERGDETAEERILDERQRYGHKHPEAVRAHVVGGFLDGLVDLPQSGDTASCAGRQRADDKDDDEDESRAVKPLQESGVEQAAREAAYVANAEHGARHRHGKHGDRLDKALGLKLPLDDEIRDDHAQQRRDGRGDQAENKRVAERLEARGSA